jgi:pantoate--beta-alanine ligase
MKIFNSINEFCNSQLDIESFVPTMGNLHEGHLSLINTAKKNSKNICVSIYVNKNQFTNKKDFDSYPITLDEDIYKLEKAGVNYLLNPCKDDIENNSSPFDAKFEPKYLTNDLCGKYRKGHFLAVMDIVHRLFQIVNPKNIILGEKDYQQIFVIKELIEICKYNIKIITSPTIREKGSGLALSSRNSLLTAEQKKMASEIYKALKLSTILYEDNVPLDQIKDKIYEIFEQLPIEIEYFTFRDLKTLQQANDNDLIALIAGYLGNVRLIDNIIVKSKTNL